MINDFFTSLFSFFGLINLNSDYDYMFNLSADNLLGSVGLAMIFISLVMVLAYYYVIDSPGFNRPVNWLMINLATAGLISIVARAITADSPTSMGIQDIVLFIIIVFFYSTIYFLIFSMALKHWSVNCRDTPIRTR